MIKKEMTTILGSGLSGMGAVKLAIKKNISVYLSDHSVFITNKNFIYYVL